MLVCWYVVGWYVGMLACRYVGNSESMVVCMLGVGVHCQGFNGRLGNFGWCRWA